MTTFDSAHAALVDAYPDPGTRFSIDSTSFDISSPGVDAADANDLMVRVFGDHTFIPTWIPAGVRIDRLHLERSDADHGFDFAMTIIADVDWHIVDGFAITGAALSIGYDDGGLWGVVSGSALLAGLDLGVSVAIPQQIVEASLHSVDDDAQFFRRQGFTPPADSSRTPATEPVLIDASLYGDIAHHQFVLHVAAEDLVDVQPFHLAGIEIEAHLGSEFRTTLWADLRLDLATLGPVSISAIADITGTAWSFEGRLDATDDFTLGTLTADIATAFGASTTPHLPAVVADAVVDHLTVGFDTGTADFTFECELRWPADDVSVTISLHHAADILTAHGTMRVGALRFDLVFDRATGNDGDKTALIGVFSADGGVEITLADVVSHLDGDGSVMGDLAADFSFGLHDAVLAWEKSSPTSGGAAPGAGATPVSGAPTVEEPSVSLLFAADLDVGVDLSGLGSLPLIGAMLPRDESLRLTFRPIVSTAWSEADLRPVSDALPDDVPPLPTSLEHGARIDAHLQLGAGPPIELTLVDVPADASTSDTTGDATAQLAHDPPSGQGATPVTSAADASPDDVEWHDIDRSFGPVRVSQVGVHFDTDTKTVELLLSGSISVGGLELTLMGLGARYGLDSQHLDVTLHGLGLALKRQPMEIAGGFANVDGDFAGKVVVRTEEFAITALGAFTMIRGAPSMFLYGILDYPLGGPAFFFVDGLALGFGYNRRFVPPSIDAVRSFPLITDAAGSTTAPVSVDEQLTRLHSAVPPAVGEYFVAVGVKFTSFKLLESFVLLVVAFGDHVEIDVMGTSTYQTPPGDLGAVPPMARAELDLIGRIVPDEGSILIQAQLSDSSYVYNPLCHIFGGFAFASWFAGDNEGDFVLSVGGYHPSFTPPPYYPVPPRIGVKYQITPHVYVKGEGYFALTPSLFMAGAALEASAEIGAASASFRLSVDFLIGWEPYHYDAHLHVDVAAKWHCFHASASVDLHIWGPDFAGHAEVKWTVFSFDVSFGHATSRGPTPIGFDRFREAFLPAPDKALSIRCAGGLVDSVDGVKIGIGAQQRTATVWNVDPKNLRIETSSIIPEAVAGGDAIGIAAMNRHSLDGTAQEVTITRDGVPVYPSTDPNPFRVEPLAPKMFPSALWGTTIGRSLHDEPVDATAGHRVTVTDPVKEAQTHDVRRSALVATTPEHAYAGNAHWSLGASPVDRSDHAVRQLHPGLPWNRIRQVEMSGGLG